jgi:hypothetical protein
MIHPLRKPVPAIPVVQETGTVEAWSAGAAAVRTPSGVREARRAVSCLVEPEIGDHVLVAGDEEGQAFVLAVLARKPGAAVRLGAEGDVTWTLPDGKFTVAAAQAIELATPGTATVAAGALRVTAGDARLHLDHVSFLGRLVHAQAETVKLVAGALDQTLERFWHRVKRSYRFIAEQDHVRAGHLDYAAKETAHLRGKNTLVTAEQLVKVDAGQVHLG